MIVFRIDTREGNAEDREIHSVIDTLAEIGVEHREKGRIVKVWKEYDQKCKMGVEKEDWNV